MSANLAANWTLREASARDAYWIAELRAVVLRPDLERLGRFDPVRVRQRFLAAFEPASTRVVLVDGKECGSIAVRAEGSSLWIEHFYLRPELQGRGVGSAVLKSRLASGTGNRPFRLNVLQGSRARALYERHGFTVEREDAVDVFMVRCAGVLPTPAAGRLRGNRQPRGRWPESYRDWPLNLGTREPQIRYP